MSKRKIFVHACFFILLSSHFVSFDCVAGRLIFNLHAEEIPSNEAWKDEFSDITSKTANSMAISTEALQSLVERCDKLQPIIEELEATPRKIYLKRLKKSKSIFNFVIESREEIPNK
jgi:hypothetical protein